MKKQMARMMTAFTAHEVWSFHLDSGVDDEERCTGRIVDDPPDDCTKGSIFFDVWQTMFIEENNIQPV